MAATWGVDVLCLEPPPHEPRTGTTNGASAWAFTALTMRPWSTLSDVTATFILELLVINWRRLLHEY